MKVSASHEEIRASRTFKIFSFIVVYLGLWQPTKVSNLKLFKKNNVWEEIRYERKSHFRGLAAKQDMKLLQVDSWTKASWTKWVNVFVQVVTSIHLILEVTFRSCRPVSLHTKRSHWLSCEGICPPSRNPTCWALTLTCEWAWVSVSVVFFADFWDMLRHGD